jgi:hypothetical protein
MSETFDLVEEMFVDAASAAANIKETALGEIQALVLELRTAQRAVEQATKSLTAAEADLKEIEAKRLPDLLQKYGMSSIEMTDGSILGLSTIYHANISEERKPKAHAWLRDEGLEDLIKTELKLAFSKGHAEDAAAAKRALSEAGFVPSVNENVNAQTLKAFVRRRIEEKKPLDLALFGVFTETKAELKAPKKGLPK